MHNGSNGVEYVDELPAERGYHAASFLSPPTCSSATATALVIFLLVIIHRGCPSSSSTAPALPTSLGSIGEKSVLELVPVIQEERRVDGIRPRKLLLLLPGRVACLQKRLRLHSFKQPGTHMCCACQRLKYTASILRKWQLSLSLPLPKKTSIQRLVACAAACTKVHMRLHDRFAWNLPFDLEKMPAKMTMIPPPSRTGRGCGDAPAAAAAAGCPSLLFLIMLLSLRRPAATATLLPGKSLQFAYPETA